MYLVAIGKLCGPAETPQLVGLASDLDTTAYELRLLLNGGFPAVIQVTTDAAQARSLVGIIERHGHVALLCDQSQVLSNGRMMTLRNFALTPTEVIADRATTESCPYSDITVMLRAVHRSSQTSVEQVKSRKFQPAMALATGGLVMSKKVTQDVTTNTSTREQVLYLFRRFEQSPWLLRERAANYTALGAAMGPSSAENFTKTIAHLRGKVPHAVYDERLVNSRPIRGLGDGSEATDLLAYLLADLLVRRDNEKAPQIS